MTKDQSAAYTKYVSSGAFFLVNFITRLPRHILSHLSEAKRIVNFGINAPTLVDSLISVMWVISLNSALKILNCIPIHKETF